MSLAGVIGFVGLIVPHLMRSIFGPRHLRLVPAAAAGGALFLLASDTIGRSLAPPYEIPVGIITGFLGGAFFLVLHDSPGGRPVNVFELNSITAGYGGAPVIRDLEPADRGGRVHIHDRAKRRGKKHAPENHVG